MRLHALSLRRCLLALALSAASCMRVPKLSTLGAPPGTGGTGAVAPEGRPATQARGVEIRAVPNAWSGYPAWFTRKYVPIWVSLINRGTESFDVTYGAMELINEKGERFPAVTPELAARETLDSNPFMPRFGPAQAHPSSPPWMPAQPTPSGPREQRSPIFFDLPPYQYLWEAAPAPGIEGLTPFGYVPRITPLGPQGFGRDASTIVQPALREGRLFPQTSVQGFVYFRADLAARLLTFSLDAPSEGRLAPPLRTRIVFSAR